MITIQAHPPVHGVIVRRVVVVPIEVNRDPVEVGQSGHCRTLRPPTDGQPQRRRNLPRLDAAPNGDIGLAAWHWRESSTSTSGARPARRGRRSRHELTVIRQSLLAISEQILLAANTWKLLSCRISRRTSD